MQFELHYNSQCCTNALQCIALQFTIEGKCSGMPLIAGQRGINRFHTRHSPTSYSSSSLIIISTIYNLICNLIYILIIIQTLLNQNCDHQPSSSSAFSASCLNRLVTQRPPSLSRISSSSSSSVKAPPHLHFYILCQFTEAWCTADNVVHITSENIALHCFAYLILHWTDLHCIVMCLRALDMHAVLQLHLNFAHCSRHREHCIGQFSLL